MPSVAIGPMEAAGCAAALGVGLRALGSDAEVAVSFAHPFGYPADRVLSRRQRVAYGLRAAQMRDVLHYQFGRTWLPSLVDARLARARGATVAMTFHGNDCRLYDLTRALFPPAANDPPARDDSPVRERLRRLAGVCHAAIVKDLELLAYVAPFFERTYLLPLPLYPVPVAEPTPGDPPVVLHAPSDPRTKGTAIIEATMASLGRSADLRVLSGVAHDRVQAELGRATVVVDQLNFVSIGIFALEAMRAGVPVLAEYDPRLLAPYQIDVPVVRVTPESLGDELEALLGDTDRRRELGERGREYVARHEPARVAAAALRIYEHAPGAPAGIYEATTDDIRRFDPMPAAEREERRTGRRHTGVAS